MKPEEVSALARSGADGYLEPEDVRAICTSPLPTKSLARRFSEKIDAEIVE